MLVRFDLAEVIQRHQRHDLTAVLNHLLTTGLFNRVRSNVLQSGDRGKLNGGTMKPTV